MVLGIEPKIVQALHELSHTSSPVVTLDTSALHKDIQAEAGELPDPWSPASGQKIRLYWQVQDLPVVPRGCCSSSRPAQCYPLQEALQLPPHPDCRLPYCRSLCQPHMLPSCTNSRKRHLTFCFCESLGFKVIRSL